MVLASVFSFEHGGTRLPVLKGQRVDIRLAEPMA
jgi:hypothetical protein